MKHASVLLWVVAKLLLSAQTELVILSMLVRQLVANYFSTIEICLQQRGNAATGHTTRGAVSTWVEHESLQGFGDGSFGTVGDIVSR